eukprot:gene14610-14734_t
MRNAIGIDIGGTKIRAARVSADGKIVDRLIEPTEKTPSAVLAQIEHLFNCVADQKTSAIGIGIPGRVNAITGEVLSGGYVNLSGAVLADLARKCGNLPLFYDNDASMALIAEARLGAARNSKHGVMLTIGTGIGGALMLDGKIVHGKAAAGQLGHVTIDINGPACLCGRMGCLETFSSGTALGRLIAASSLEATTTLQSLIARNDDAARDILNRWIKPLRAGIDSLVAAFDPEIVVLGGGLGADACRALEGFAAASPWYQCAIVPAMLGDDAGVIAGRMKTAIFVNGVPASGKSTVAAHVAAQTGWPLLALDTVKEALFAHLGTGDRDYNRMLGRASYQAIFAQIGDFPNKSGVVIDAWFGFQPRQVLDDHIQRAGLARIGEIWCHAPPKAIGTRYAARVQARSGGHLGLDYVPELIALATQAKPLGDFPLA